MNQVVSKANCQAANDMRENTDKTPVNEMYVKTIKTENMTRGKS